MSDIALMALILISALSILENILCINDILHSRHSHNIHGISIVLDIAWIIICVVALCLGGSFATAAISAATLLLILTVIGDIFTLTKYESIYDAVGMAIHTGLLILLLAV